MVCLSLPRKLPQIPIRRRRPPPGIATCTSCFSCADLSCVSDSCSGKKPTSAPQTITFLSARKFAALRITLFAGRASVRHFTRTLDRPPGSRRSIPIELLGLPALRQLFRGIRDRAPWHSVHHRRLHRHHHPRSGPLHLRRTSWILRRVDLGAQPLFFSAGRFPGFGILPPAPFFFLPPSSLRSMSRRKTPGSSGYR